MKILLINPPPRKITNESVVVPPLGLAYLAAVLEKANFDVKILDAFALQLSWNDFEVAVKHERSDLVGISGMSPVIDTTFRAAKICKKYSKYIVMGGPHVSIFKDEVFNQCPEVDFAIYGEGEIAFLEFIKRLDENTDFKNVRGLISRDRVNPPQELIENLDSIPFPARHLLPNSSYKYVLSVKENVTTMFTSRGCTYKCIFCDKSVFGSKWRSRSPENILDEIEKIIKDIKVDSIIFYDDLFTLKKERVLKFCEEILKRRIKIDWKCEGRADLVDEEMLSLMKRAGCSMIAYGVESGNEKGLEYLNKKTHLEDIRKAFKLTHKAGIRTMAYFILGIPNETYNDELKTIEFAKELNPTYAQFSALSPYYGTWIYEEAKRRGWYREINAQNPVDKDLKKPVVISENWDEEKIKKIIKVAHQKFYMKPSYIIKKLFEIKTFTQFFNMAKTGTSLFLWYFKKK